MPSLVEKSGSRGTLKRQMPKAKTKKPQVNNNPLNFDPSLRTTF
jgi:hypothetical protein